MRKHSLYPKFLFDLFFAFLFFILLLPIFLLICFLVYIKIGKPIFFVQERPGRNGKVFKMYKFRSMLDSNDGVHFSSLSDSSRITPFGKWLRSTSLDEIPELFNVIKGDMSIVGPRPLLKEYLPLYSTLQARRHEVRPGITGWAQINGRNALPWSDKFALDVWYVDNYSLMLDIYIMINTFIKVIKRENITTHNSETAEPFLGN